MSCLSHRRLVRPNCLNPLCKRPEKIRGLCWSCYQAARRLVARKEITWEALEKAGRVKNRKSPHFKSTTTINWLLTGQHIDELEYQETGKITCRLCGGTGEWMLPVENMPPCPDCGAKYVRPNIPSKKGTKMI
jgi:hypothetical protein